MSCEQLAANIAHLDPTLAPAEVARLCLLILNEVDDPATLHDSATLRRLWRSVSFRLDAATDQYAAMSEELDRLCQQGPVRFDADQIWTLLRAVQTHGQLLELYSGRRSEAAAGTDSATDNF
ncbi:hypothetical protein [Roseimaritima sediminicola]|uniref:hypothetical protein n=1 Tax=Roseimaritima sediminicola TaxID=2662066 RepID=UPI00129856F4|nr:hypothetical protein [Roseimaritima sediminicola]